MTPRAVLVVILLVAIGCVLLALPFARGLGTQPTTYAPVPYDQFVRLTPTPSPSATPSATPTIAPTPIAVSKPEHKVVPKPVIVRKVSRSIGGTATWYCLPSWPSVCMAKHRDPAGMYAAAGPALRVALGGTATRFCPCPWRNKLVKVTALGRSVWVRLADWCLCTGPAHPSIDLYSGPFAFLAGRPKYSPGGGLEVKISW